jgi:hypothetical protein
VEPFAATDTLLKGAIDNVRDSLEKFRELQEAYLENLDREDIRARLAGGLWQPYFANVNGWQPQGPLWGSMPQKEFRQASGDISFKSHFLEMPAQFEFTLPSKRINTPHSRQAQAKAMAEPAL